MSPVAALDGAVSIRMVSYQPGCEPKLMRLVLRRFALASTRSGLLEDLVMVIARSRTRESVYVDEPVGEAIDSRPHAHRI